MSPFDDTASLRGMRPVGGRPPSVLWRSDEAETQAVEQPQCFVDLNLDQIAKDILAGFEAYDLLPILRTPLRTVEAVSYRQAVMADVERPEIQSPIRAFAGVMRRVRWSLVRAAKMYDERQQQRWFLDAADRYVTGVGALLDALLRVDLASPALVQVRDFLSAYAGSVAFIDMAEGVDRLAADLAAIHYKVRIRGLRVDVEPGSGEADYSQAVLHTFDRFRQGGARDFSFDIPDDPDMDHVEASILEQLAKMNTAVFARLSGFKSAHNEFQDAGVLSFDREIQVYLAYLDYIAPLRASGLPFCVPVMSGPDEPLAGDEVFDLALAKKLLSKQQSPVANDFQLGGAERMLVVSGPNQGGKTTFARAFGQVHYLASLGLPVPGRRAALRQFDHLFTHFERGENIADLRGKLEDDLVRVHEMLAVSSPSTVIVFNEMFTSTTFRDALVLSKAIMRQLVDGNLTAVWVTFIDELSALNAHTVSMVSNIDPEDPSRRTFKIVRRPADGLAYAQSIAQKWGVTLGQIRARMAR